MNPIRVVVEKSKFVTKSKILIRNSIKTNVVGNLDKWAIEVGGSKNGSAEPNDNGLFKELGSVFTNLVGTFERRLDGGITKFDCV